MVSTFMNGTRLMNSGTSWNILGNAIGGKFSNIPHDGNDIVDQLKRPFVRPDFQPRLDFLHETSILPLGDVDGPRGRNEDGELVPSLGAEDGLDGLGFGFIAYCCNTVTNNSRRRATDFPGLRRPWR